MAAKVKAFVYLMANWNNSVLYLGVTNNLLARVAEHKAGVKVDAFTNVYNCHKLVYYEEGHSIKEAILREKQLKNWKRAWKNELVESMNPQWFDLSEELGLDDQYVKTVAQRFRGNGDVDVS